MMDSTQPTKEKTVLKKLHPHIKKSLGISLFNGMIAAYIALPLPQLQPISALGNTLRWSLLATMPFFITREFPNLVRNNYTMNHYEYFVASIAAGSLSAQIYNGVYTRHFSVQPKVLMTGAAVGVLCLTVETFAYNKAEQWRQERLTARRGRSKE